MFTASQIRRAAEMRREAFEGRGQRSAGTAAGVLADPQRSQTFPAQMRAQKVTGSDGKEFARLAGQATTYGQPYEIWDMWGPYMETVAQGAGSVSLSANPDVVFLVNHKGLSLARTINDTLTLAESETGLDWEATCNPKRTDVSDLALAVEDGTVTECSFAFRITSGDWSPDYSAYTITGYDIDRGDVSACTYGANPTTSIEARSQALRTLETLDPAALRLMHDALGERLSGERGAAPAPVGLSVVLARQLLDAGRL